MSQLFYDSPDQIQIPGAFAIEMPAPRLIGGVSNGFIGLAGQFEWGPAQTLVTPADAKSFIDMFAPAGAPRTSTGYRAVMKRVGFTAKIVRVLGAGAVAASLAKAGTGGNVNLAAKYPGTLGNSIQVQQKAPASGAAGKKDYVVSLTNSVTGSTIETYYDVPVPTGTLVTVDVSASKLLASFTLDSTLTAFPADFTSGLITVAGTNGAAIGTSDYVGTPGANDKGVALFEPDPDVRVLVHDDCGATNRAAINAGFAAQCALLRDRRAVLELGETTDAWATLQADMVAALQTDRVIPVAGWVTCLDDAGVTQTVPMSTFIASALINLEPQQSHAWRDARVKAYYKNITGVVAGFAWSSGTIQAQATRTQPYSICLPVKLADGTIMPLHDRSGDKSFQITRRIKDYFALSVIPALDPWVNGPNVADDNAAIQTALDNFAQTQVGKKRLLSYTIDTATPNNTTTQAAGDFYINLVGRSPAARERILLQMQIGPTVVVSTN